MQVSVVIPAYNAVDTIGDALQSLLEQTFTQWEAIVVNDGSTDHTVEIVKQFIARDERIRIVNQENQGVSAARNSGIALAAFNWLLFLDANDWIFPHHLERLTNAVQGDPSLDAVYCGWVYALPDKEYVFPQLPTLKGDLFDPFTQYCVSVVHTFLVPRSLVIAVGSFNIIRHSCEDWDLWQRIARTGARFGVVKEVLAAYRTQPNSLSRNGHQLLLDGTQVLLNGHSPDNHILPAHPVYPNGLPRENLTKNKFDLLCACAGYLIGGGKDARSLLEILKGETCSSLIPHVVTRCVLIHALVSASRPREEWHMVWSSCQELFSEFLLALEAQSGTKKLASHGHAIANKLLEQYMSRPYWQEGVNVASFDVAWQKPFNYLPHLVKQFGKRSLWTALLMLPHIRRLFHWIKQLCSFLSLLVRKSPKTVERQNQVDYHRLPTEIAKDIVLTQEKPMPILSYRSIDPSNEGKMAWSVTPEIFEAQLRHIREAGYCSISLSDWGYSIMANIPVNHRSITLVFANAHASFFPHAWPLLKKHGVSVTVFLYADEVGKSNAIDPASGNTISLMDWKQIRQLQAEGVKFGSHGLNRKELTALPLPIAWQHIKKSKTILEAELGMSIPLFAYPNGRFNPVLQYLVGLAGYDFALSAKPGICTKKNSLLALPSLAINHSTDFKILLPD